MAAFLGRQFGFRWRWTSGMFVPHIMNRATCLLELTMLIVVVVTVWGRIQPASPANVLLACTFLLYYASVVASGLATSQGFHTHRIGRLLTARILVPFLTTVYSFAISRFGALQLWLLCEHHWERWFLGGSVKLVSLDWCLFGCLTSDVSLIWSDATGISPS